ncbi:hypothetical protein ENSA5_41640 [Enhygromyxa salina]|uniref:Carboxypeptidase regulatory-like domain-containing protein n=2 Tax=Enhygromyxa salina TaxID=215803 RepID=A0A2S9XMH9_9BACT|nr:hypothetical protein ENSA5_41640 [Enhygromyxa salina]
MTGCGDGGGEELADETGEAGDGDTGDGDTGDGDTGDGDGDGDPGDGDGDGEGELIEVSGDAFAFGPGTMIADATVTILEHPEQIATTDADGHFVFEGLAPGSAATFVMDKDGFPVIYTKTFTLPDSGVVERVTFQVPDDATFDALALVAGIEPDPATCQIASTVTRVGKSLYDAGAHGEAGATVTIDPPLPPEHGPVYFNANVIPQPDLVETSEDGGILYTNVPPGVYTIHASKEGVEFEDVVIQCDADVLVNPSPPHGLQAI